ncbi:hypothetical protein [Marinomonas transparens]|uniref:Uncharacterized protein n=1 Tax=Marinomonas transparens TaxID=2795388 RepID=A0A934JLT8_9GAMM|nr:hypothetical protein [Marinomonas transparens]MBJ7538156.1 hypothetical protein [Marinomonas transparens]
MPIANCVITQECPQGTGNIIELWAQESGISAEHMTINIMTSSEQLGNTYKIMANLALPSMWSAPSVSLLQLGLAKALAKYFAVAINEVHVITSVVASGMVVDSGQEIKW